MANMVKLQLPEPKIVIVGQTGAGKSTLANVLLGDTPDCKNCTFPVCSTPSSCTKATTYAAGNWLGQGPNFTVVDTPGFGDSDQDDNSLIDEMMSVLKGTLRGANAIVLLVNGEEERINASIQQMLREMQALFGESFWNSSMLGVSHWPFDAQSIKKRNFTGRTEEKFLSGWNQLLSEKFKLNITLPGVFIDSYAKQPWNLDDMDQQEAFARETGKLWSFSKGNDLFMFRTIQDVLKENQKLKDEIRCLNSTLSTDVEDLKDGLRQLNRSVIETKNGLTDAHNLIGNNSILIQDNSNLIQDNSNLIHDNKEELKNGLSQLNGSVIETRSSVHDLEIDNDNIKLNLNVAQKSIGDTNQKLNTEIRVNSEQDELIKQTKNGLMDANNLIGNNSVLIKDNKEDILKLRTAPLGTIMAWVNRPGPNTKHVENLPEGWIRCDGSVIPAPSVWEGQSTPNLNGENRFLRGALDGEQLMLEEDSMQSHTHGVNDPGHQHGYNDKWDDKNMGDGGLGTGSAEDYKVDRWDASHQSTSDPKKTGISITDPEGARVDSETRPKNMRVIYIMRVF